MTAVQFWEYPTAIAALIVALGVIGKGIHWVYLWAQRIDGSLSYIESEMRFNGGATLRDAVKRIEVRLSVMEQNQDDIRHDIKGDTP